MSKMDEWDLLKILAACWNTLDAHQLEKVLKNDLLYESQWTFTPIYGKANFLNYLDIKFSRFKELKKKGDLFVEAEMGKFPSLDFRPGIVLRQGGKNNYIQVTVLIEIKNQKISTIEVCLIPDPSEAKLTGVFPGKDENNVSKNDI